MGTAMAQTIQPITWNVVGLDSNNVSVGPNVFPVGARVCNNTLAPVAANAWQAKFNWVTSSTYIDRTSPQQLPVGALAVGACQDVFHEVSVVRDAAAYDQRAQYNIEVVNSAGASLSPVVATPANREIYVERLISQNRNAVLGYVYNGNPIAAGGSINVAVGQTFDLTLNARTATQGYEQLEKFIELNPTLFRVNKVTSTYSANSGTDPNAGNKIYADGCGWQNDITATTGGVWEYHNNLSCLGTGKYGGSITQKYNITVLDAPAAPATQVESGALVYDFSGSSYHYNGDFDSGGITFNFSGAPLPPTGADIELTKSVLAGNAGSYTFFLQVKNLGPADATSVVVTDNVPDGYTIDNNQGAGWDGFTVSRVGSLITWTVGALANGQVLTLPIKVNRVNNGTNYVNTAVVTSSDDPNPDNNTSAVVASAVVADLAISKTTSYTAPLKIGDALTFTVSLANLGTSAATGVVVSDTVPAGYSVSSATCATGWTANHSAPVYRCTANADVAVNATPAAVLTISATALAPADPTDLSAYLNSASVSSTSSDPVSGNNTATASQAPTFLTIAKTSSADSFVAPTSTGSYTLTVTKNGTSVDLGTLTVADVLPAGVTATSITGSGWTCTLATVSCTRNDDQAASPTVVISPTAYPAITLNVSFDGPSQATLINRASVTAEKNGLVTSFDETSKTVSWTNNAVYYTVTATSALPAGGSASCTPASVLSGSSSTCTAVPNTGYRFTGWSGDCSSAGTATTCSLTNITSNQASQANFALITYTVGATVSGSGGEASCTEISVASGGGSVCTATPAPGYRFVAWTGSCTGATATCTLSGITANQASVATFELIPTYTVVATTSGNGTASCTPSPVAEGGSSVCTATPAPGQEFAGWTGACQGQGPVCTLTNINADQASVAAFQAPTIQPVPTLSEWAMIVMATLMAMFGFAVVRRQA